MPVTMNISMPYPSENLTEKLPLGAPNLPNYLIMASLVFLAFPLFGQAPRPAIAEPLGQMIENSPVFSRIFTGFALYDPESDEFICQKDAGKYFTPASNTKVFTLYTALQVLGDSIPSLRYVVNKDSLVFWGTGNPLLLHPQFQQDSTVLEFLKSRPEQLFFSPHNYDDERFGPGWSWGDFQYAYQVEKSPLPLYGNVVHFQRRSIKAGFDVTPSFFKGHVVYNAQMDKRNPEIKRQEHANIFEYNAPAMTGLPFERTRPFRSTPSVVTALLSDTLGRVVRTLDLKRLPPRNARTIQIPLPDTLYRRLMKESDNFVAEQLLLMVSDKLYGTQNTTRAIRYAIDNLFADAPDQLVWRDGSGLSRYNLFTPRTLVYVLNKIYRTLPRERLFDILPAGGVSGTIDQWYGGSNGTPPYVFAKTGTLSNKHCLSGFLITRSDRLLIFSFMHNNYINGTDELKEEMEKVLEWIRDHY